MCVCVCVCEGGGIGLHWCSGYPLLIFSFMVSVHESTDVEFQHTLAPTV